MCDAEEDGCVRLENEPGSSTATIAMDSVLLRIVGCSITKGDASDAMNVRISGTWARDRWLIDVGEGYSFQARILHTNLFGPQGPYCLA